MISSGFIRTSRKQKRKAPHYMKQHAKTLTSCEAMLPYMAMHRSLVQLYSCQDQRGRNWPLFSDIEFFVSVLLTVLVLSFMKFFAQQCWCNPKINYVRDIL